MFQTNADFLINQLTKYFYTRHLTLVLYFKRKFRSPSLNTLKISIFYSIFTSFHSGWGVLYFQRNTNFVIIEWNINNFAQETLYLPFIFEKIGSVRRKHFSKHPLFTPISLFSTESEVCNIPNEYWLPNKSATKISLHKTPYTALSFQQKVCALNHERFQKNQLFTTFLPNLTEDEVCNIWNKYRYCKSLRTY